jgi:hypothetical protein
MNPNRDQFRRCAARFTLAALPFIGVAFAPSALADDDCIVAPYMPECQLINPTAGLTDPTEGGAEPGGLVLPVDGGPAELALSPAPPGGLAITADGGLGVAP